ncbi:MAG: sulfite exporter TauE/SafE family protein [Propioniciclava sp.]|uniref:TSUP family transporter n=1 Tax=Propioniciclava sp. TaxID=2038686 RepID=UPI0039E24071
MDAATLAAVGAFVLLGAATQRITGMGFALVASPLLVLALGPLAGVQLSQVLGLSVSALVLAQVWRAAEGRKAVGLFLPALIGIIPGAWVTRTLPPAILSIVIGALVLIALLATVASERARVFRGTPGLLAAGFLSGFMNVTAGVGGPAIVLYALSTDWKHEDFVATVQLYFVGLNIASLTARGLPALEDSTWIVVGIALAIGLAAGSLLAAKVSASLARRLVVVVAVLGSLATVAKGVLALH